MASKQLGKLRQWAGEVILSRDKTTLSEEFQELEKDIELRKDGATKLLAASEAYHHSLVTKKKNDAFEDSDKLLPIDTLGVVMIFHGEEFGDDSAFGTSLVKFGRAHCKVAALQEAFALTLKDTFLTSLEKYTGEIKEYEAQRKKLESRRLSYDAAVTKYEKLKNSKKEKERREAEEEMEKARDRYDETSEEVKAQMHAIQNKEMDQLRDLTGFLDQEIHFVEEHLNVLKDIRNEWYDESSLVHVPPQRTTAPPHVFSRSRTSLDSEHEISRKLSKSPKPSSKPPSRPASRSSRNRADSGATAGDKDEKDKASRRMSVADWASSAMDSMTGRGKKKEKFSSLETDEFEGEADEDDMRSSPLKKSSTFHSLTRKLSSKSRDASPRSSSPRILRPPSQEKKLVRATHSFSGGLDELSFVAGEEITVLNEVLDDWWMGELNGKKGLFPTTYVEAVPPKPIVPRRPTASLRVAALSASHSPDDEALQHPADDDSISYSLNDFDDDHDFGRKPLSAHHNAAFFTGPSDDASVISSLRGEEDDKFLVPFSPTTNFNSGFDDDFQAEHASGSSPEMLTPRASRITSPPTLPRRVTETAVLGSTMSGKKPPPPPPPRRSNTTALGPSPPIPERPYKIKTITPTSSISSRDQSPFESVTELSMPEIHDNGCGDFKQNPFQAKGICSNCFQFHG